MARKKSVPDMFDVVIAGGGYVGLSLAVALKQGDAGLTCAVVDPKPMEDLHKDPRASAIAAAASRMLSQLGIWQKIAGEAQPINEMIVTDSKLRDAVRPVFLTFGGEATEGEPFAHMMPNGVMMPALYKAAKALGVSFFAPGTAETFRTHPDHVELVLEDGTILKSRLLVAATVCAPACATLPVSGRSTGTTASPASSQQSSMNGLTTAGRKNIFCLPGHLRSCPCRATGRRWSGRKRQRTQTGLCGLTILLSNWNWNAVSGITSAHWS